jgi:hypothetical protein
MDTHIFSISLLQDAILSDDFNDINQLDYTTLLCVARSHIGENDHDHFTVSFSKFREIMNDLGHHDPKVVLKQFEWAEYYCGVE